MKNTEEYTNDSCDPKVKILIEEEKWNKGYNIIVLYSRYNTVKLTSQCTENKIHFIIDFHEQNDFCCQF